jgi:prepilin-type N-terminal cleavage/methylation domain-containing protein
MNKKIRNQNQGFTIIEVLIVLAIAGLIMLIVFLAVPALQRQSRNTARKNDVGRVGASVTEYSSNRNGALPTNGGDITPLVGTLAQYETGNIQVATGTGGADAITDVSQMRVVTGARCSASNNGTVAGGSTRQVAIQYAVETSNGSLAVCQDV